MKKIILISGILISMACMSCKKTWQCECKNANSTYAAGEIEDSKRKAKKSCEALSSSSTECYLK